MATANVSASINQEQNEWSSKQYRTEPPAQKKTTNCSRGKLQRIRGHLLTRVVAKIDAICFILYYALCRPFIIWGLFLWKEISRVLNPLIT